MQKSELARVRSVVKSLRADADRLEALADAHTEKKTPGKKNPAYKTSGKLVVKRNPAPPKIGGKLPKLGKGKLTTGG